MTPLFTVEVSEWRLYEHYFLSLSAVKSLPFGGVGHSGMGTYHGSDTFETFTHLKPVYSTGTDQEANNKYATSIAQLIIGYHVYCKSLPIIQSY